MYLVEDNIWLTILTPGERGDCIHHLSLTKYVIKIREETSGLADAWQSSDSINSQTIKAVAEAGLKMVFSNVDSTYLDCGFGSRVSIYIKLRFFNLKLPIARI